VDPAQAEGQARAYAEQFGGAFIFLANGRETGFWDYQREAHSHRGELTILSAALYRSAWRQYQAPPMPNRVGYFGDQGQ
jgi:type I restriction enzyme, R subunit